MKSVIPILAILSGAMWGSAGIFVRGLADAGLDNITIVFGRTSVAVFMLLAIILLMDRKILKIGKKDIPLFLACGISIVGLNVFYTVSVAEVSLSLAAVLLGLSPAFMMVFATILFKEKVTSKKLTCMVVSIVGCVMVSGALDGNNGLSVAGVSAGLASAIFYAIYGIMSKGITSKGYNVFSILFYCMVICTVALIPLTDFGTLIDFETETPLNIGFLAFNALVTFILPYMFYTLAISGDDVTTPSILAACAEPTSAMFFGLVFFGEGLSLTMLLGMVLAVGAMAYICIPTKESKTS